MTSNLPKIENLSEISSVKMKWVAPQVQEFDLLAETQGGGGFGGDFTAEQS